MQPLFDVALNNALVAGVLGLLVLAIGRVWRRPALVHALWLVVLVKLITPAFVSIPVPFAWSPPADVRVDVAIGTPDQKGEGSGTGSAKFVAKSEAGAPIAPPAPAIGESRDGRSSDAIRAQTAPDSTASSADASRGPHHISLLTCLMAVWVIGACGFLFRSAVSIVRFQRLLKYAEPVGTSIQERIDRLSTAMTLQRPPAAFLVPGAVSPMLWAFGGRARLLLPGQLLDELSIEAQETVFVHELAHYRRGDHRVRALELIVGSLFWWHPIVWLATRELRQIEEECCDACVVELLPEHRSTYARTLVQTVGFLSARPTLLPAAAGALGKGIYRSVEQRIRSIMSDSPMKGVSMSPVMRLGLLVFALIVLPLVPVAGQGDPTPVISANIGAAPKKPPADEPTSFSGSVAALGNVADVTVSPDGRLLAAGHGLYAGPGALSIWDLEKGRLLGSFGERRAVLHVAFSKDSRFLAYGTRDNLVGIRRTDTLAVVQELAGMDFLPLHVAFSPDGRQLAVAHRKIVVYDTETWKPVPLALEDDPLLAKESFELTAVDFSADGTRLLAGGGNRDGKDLYGRTVVWDAKTGKQVCAAPHTSRLFNSVFSPDGKLFATAGEDGRSQICDAETGDVLRLCALRGTPLYDVAWSSDGTRLVGVGAIMGYAVFDASSGKTLHVFAKPDDGKIRLNTACFTPDRTKIITGNSEKTISIWDTKSYAQLSQFPSSDVTQVAEQPVHSVACSPDGRWIAAGRDDAGIAIHNSDSGHVVRVLKGHTDVVATVTFSSKGILASAGYDETIKLWDTAVGTTLRTLKGHENWVFGVAFAPDAKTLASGGYDRTVRLWNVATGEQTAVIEGHSAAVRAVAFSPDGTLLASGGSDRTVRLYDVATRREVALLKGHEGNVRAVAFSPDGRTLASVAEDGTGRLWNVADRKERNLLKGHEGIVWSVAFSAGGKNLATGGFDRTIRLWNPGTGELRQTLQGHGDGVSSVAFAPDTSALVSGGLDRTVRIWRAAGASATSGKPVE